MSLPVMLWVFEHSDAKLGARLVLLALAEFAHDDGTRSFPCVDSIAKRANMSRRGVQAALRKLVAEGMIEQTGTTRTGTAVWSVQMGGEEAALASNGGVKLTTSRGEVASPDPLGPVSKSPSGSERPRNLVWEALARQLNPQTKSERSDVGKTEREIREACAGLDDAAIAAEVDRRAAAYWPGLTRTPRAFRQRWAELGRLADVNLRGGSLTREQALATNGPCQSCGGEGSSNDTAYSCPDCGGTGIEGWVA